MTTRDHSILVVNGGSSSLKFAVYRVEGSGEGPQPVLAARGKVDRIGAAGATLSATSASDPGDKTETAIDGSDHRAAAGALLDWLASQQAGAGGLASLGGIGHRVVHGMAHTEPERVTPELLDELRGLVPVDPDHLPLEIELIEAFGQRLGEVPQIVCFDTCFHAGLPAVARTLAIPRRYQAQGIRRYGFHGISYAYLTAELARIEPRPERRRRVVLAHLGSGASLAAVQDGASIDTSMGFSPTAGLPMSSRSGDIDPGVAAYLARTEQMSSADFFRMASHESGLLGISETSADMRDLLAHEKTDARAAEAVALFCYQARKTVGAYAAALGGIDTLVFSGGIGEQAAPVRARICEGLGFLGIALDAGRNECHAAVISSDAATTTVRVIPTDEELMIARSVCRLLGLPSNEPGAST